jgi:hypothetical protein
MVASVGVVDAERVEWPALGQKEEVEAIEDGLGVRTGPKGAGAEE